jgi:hypothetical protein
MPTGIDQSQTESGRKDEPYDQAGPQLAVSGVWTRSDESFEG